MPSARSLSPMITAEPTVTANNTPSPTSVTATATANGGGQVVFSGILKVATSVPQGYTFQINMLGTNSGQTDLDFCGPVRACSSGREYTQGLGVQPGFSQCLQVQNVHHPPENLRFQTRIPDARSGPDRHGYVAG